VDRRIVFNSRCSGSGFAILEALIATLIFAVSIGVIFQSISSSLALLYKSKMLFSEAWKREAIAAAYLIGDVDWLEKNDVEVVEKEKEYKDFAVEYVVLETSSKNRIILLERVSYAEESAQEKEQ